MVNLGNIVVNSGSEGDINNQNATTILKDILKALKTGNDEAKQTRKLTQSGLLNKIAGGVGLGAAAAKVGGGAAVGGALTGGIFDVAGSGDFINNFKKFTGQLSTIFEQVTTPGGEEFVLEINDKTQEVVRVLTKREATEQGILDETGKLKRRYETSNSRWDEINKDSAKIGDKLILAKKDILDYQKRIDAIKTLTFLRQNTVEDIKDLELTEKDIQKQINSAKQQLLDTLRRKEREAAEKEFFGFDTLTGASQAGPLSQEYLAGELEAFQQSRENTQFFQLHPTIRPVLQTEGEVNLPPRGT